VQGADEGVVEQSLIARPDAADEKLEDRRLLGHHRDQGVDGGPESGGQVEPAG
jgi:hypothetical protein